MDSESVIVKKALREIADRLPDEATFDDAMYALYVRRKVDEGRRAADEGRVVSHEEAKRRFGLL